MILKFPENFFWGSATSATQIETASEHNWRGLRAQDGALFERTTDHELRREEDVAYIRQFGSVYRCSVDWARLQAAPYAPFVEDVVAEYRTFFEQLRAADLKIMLVLHHFSHPIWFETAGGWLQENHIPYFVDFAQQCVASFGDFVFSWNTFNEPNLYAMNAYWLGYFPPHQQRYRRASRVLQHQVLAHDVVYDIIKAKYPAAEVGISIHTSHFRSTNFLGWFSAKAADHWFNTRPAARFSKVDYLGLNYYGCIPMDPFPVTEDRKPGKLRKMKVKHDKIRAYHPEGLGGMLRRFHRRYNKPIIVTGNGICTDDPDQRIQAIKDYLSVCHEAIQEGVALQGYIHWSTLDQFEWTLGPSYRFGLVTVDPQTKDRSMTKAGQFYADVTQKNELTV